MAAATLMRPPRSYVTAAEDDANAANAAADASVQLTVRRKLGRVILKRVSCTLRCAARPRSLSSAPEALHGAKQNIPHEQTQNIPTLALSDRTSARYSVGPR